jgi:hypothetical protein
MCHRSKLYCGFGAMNFIGWNNNRQFDLWIPASDQTQCRYQIRIAGNNDLMLRSALEGVLK